MTSTARRSGGSNAAGQSTSTAPSVASTWARRCANHRTVNRAHCLACEAIDGSHVRLPGYECVSSLSVVRRNRLAQAARVRCCNARSGAVNLGELDKKKYEGPSKVRERAQLVARRLGTYVDQVMPACVRDGVSLVFLADEAALDFVSLGLGKTNQDDRLLASMIEFKGQRSAARVVVVTADNLLRVKARARDLDVVVLPGN